MKLHVTINFRYGSSVVVTVIWNSHLDTYHLTPLFLELKQMIFTSRYHDVDLDVGAYAHR